jgi:hypothetical protein
MEGVVHNVANDVNAVVQAWSDANAEVVKGIVSVVSNLFVDINDSVAGGRRARRDQDPDTDRDDDDDDTRDFARSADLGDGVTRLSRSLSDAMNEAANVLQRSGERFQRRYAHTARGHLDDEDQNDDHEPDEAQDRRDAARQRVEDDRDDLVKGKEEK